MSDKKYKNGEIQDNGLMYDDVWDINRDGKVDWVEEMERQKDIERSQKLWEEHHKEKQEQKQYAPTPQSTGTNASGSGCLGSFLTVLFCFGGIGLCLMAENVWLKILFIFGGLALGLASAYFCGMFGNESRDLKTDSSDSSANTTKDDKNYATLDSAVENSKQKLKYAIQSDKKKLIKRIAIVSAILIAVVLLCNIGNMKNAHYYRQAISLINSGEYESAQQSLSKIEESKYKEKSELYVFCSDLENYEKGQRVNGPDYNYKPYNFDFRFNDEIETKRLAINEQLEKQAKELEQKSYNDLYNSIWNKSSEKETTTYAPITRKSYSSGSSKSRSKSKTVDPYDVNNYSNEEDFYYDHYDDFFDYYEAEDYYNDNHD